MSDTVDGGGGRPLLMVCANLAWNLVNFRAGLIAALIDDGFRVMAVAPADPAIEARLAELGCSFAAVPIDAAGLSPWRDHACGWRRGFPSSI